MLSIRELMNDPIYRAYMKKVPPNTQPHNRTPAWRIWVQSDTRAWLTKQGTYQELWPVFVRFLRNGNDVTLTNVRAFYAPPGEWYLQKVRRPTPQDPKRIVVEDRWRQVFSWKDPFAEWCGRCRRPVQFRPLFETHHALKRFPVVCDEDNVRCPICGIRRAAQPSLDQMVRL